MTNLKVLQNSRSLCWLVAKLEFVEHVRCLGHIIDNCLCDDKDINSEVKVLFTRTNILCRRFKGCFTVVKLRTVCIRMMRHYGAYTLLVL